MAFGWSGLKGERGVLKQCTDFGSFHSTSSTVLYKYFVTIVSVMNEQWKIRPEISVHELKESFIINTACSTL